MLSSFSIPHCVSICLRFACPLLTPFTLSLPRAHLLLHFLYLEEPSPTAADVSRPGMHSFTANATNFVIDSKYQPRTNLGNGAYGTVVYVFLSLYMKACVLPSSGLFVSGCVFSFCFKRS